MRRIINPAGALLALWLAGLAILAIIGARAAGHLTQATAQVATVTMEPAAINAPNQPGVVFQFTSLGESNLGLRWGDLATAIAAGLVVLLMAAVVILGRRAGLGGRPTLRLLSITGLTAALGGAAVVLADLIAGNRSDSSWYWPSADIWLAAAVLVLIGCALLAVRSVAGRVAALDQELDGVI